MSDHDWARVQYALVALAAVLAALLILCGW
jgi:hypothetical protein